MDRASLKARSRESMSWARPSAVWVTFVYFLIPLAIAIISAVSGGMGYFYGGWLRSIWIWVLTFGLSVLYSVIQAGYTKYCLDVSRNRPAGVSTLFDFVGQPLRFIGLGLLTGLVSAVPQLAGALLSWIPLFGWIVAPVATAVSVYVGLGFSMAYFVAVDYPDMGVIDCMRHSWALMAGRRWEYFVLSLSFILWMLLCVFIVPIFWVVPYTEVTFANYYNLISGQLRRENIPYGADFPHGDGPEDPPSYQDYMR